MAKRNGLVITIFKYTIIIITVLMVLASIYVGTVSSKLIGLAQQQTLIKYNFRGNVSCGDEKDHFNVYNCYNLPYVNLSFWWFIAVLTLALQDVSAIVGIIATYRESYGLTISYSALMAGVLLLNLINSSLLYTIVGPVFNALLMIIVFVYSRYLKNNQYNIAAKKIPV
jgi:hypothetical protein